MGSKEFQSEYIQYLQENNSKLMEKLNEIQENFENRVCSTDISKQYLLSTLAETLNICTILPQEIDSFFEKMTEAISVLKNILVIKSELVQLAEKISKVIKLNRNVTDEIFENTSFSNGLSNHLNPIAVTSQNKERGGTVKVSPMINGHVISTEPKICLSRISRRQVSQQLSPIVETSPTNLSDSPTSNNYCAKELKIPLQRLQIYSNKIEKDQIKKNFKLHRNWKKNLTEQRKSDCDDNTRVNETSFLLEKNKLDSQNQDEIDPLEGPSWLYKENRDISTSNNENFINTKRRRNFFPPVSCRSENFDEDSENENYAEPLVLVEENVANFLNEKIIENNFESLSFEGSPIIEMESATVPVMQQSKPNSNSSDSLQCIKEKSTKKKFLDSEAKDRIIKLQPFIKLEDCLINRNTSPKFSSKTSIQTESISDTFNSKSSFNNSTTSDESEGRKKRKAAPKNLTEPTLKVKLRRE